MLGPTYLICVKCLLCLHSKCMLAYFLPCTSCWWRPCCINALNLRLCLQLPRHNVLTIVVPCLTHKCSEMSNMFSYVIVLFSRPPFNQIIKISYATFINLPPRFQHFFISFFPRKKQNIPKAKLARSTYYELMNMSHFPISNGLGSKSQKLVGILVQKSYCLFCFSFTRQFLIFM